MSFLRFISTTCCVKTEIKYVCKHECTFPACLHGERDDYLCYLQISGQILYEKLGLLISHAFNSNY